MKKFLEELRIQRWDDHRYYHHCRINQSLHLLSAICFLISYTLLFVEPAWAALLAWLVSMTARQSGHFFFEPLGYDHVNDASNAFKESGSGLNSNNSSMVPPQGRPKREASSLVTP